MIEFNQCNNCKEYYLQKALQEVKLGVMLTEMWCDNCIKEAKDRSNPKTKKKYLDLKSVPLPELLRELGNRKGVKFNG